MATHIRGIPFPIHDHCRSRDTGNLVYMTEVLSTTPGYDALCNYLHQYPVDIDKVLVTHVISPTKHSTGPALKVAVTLQGIDYIPLGVSYLWWLDPTVVPISDLEAYLSTLKRYSTFPTVPPVAYDAPIDSWMGPRVQLQKAVKQHRAFLHKGRDYPSMSAEGREEFLWEVETCYGKLDEWPTELP